MEVTITPTKLRGSITPPASKSQAHRVIIAAALAHGESVISGVSRSEDVDATLRCMAALGARVRWQDETTVEICGVGGEHTAELLDCGESGSTLRFLIPVALVLRGGGTFTGRGRLMRRPQEPYFEIFREKGIEFSPENDMLTVKGALTPGTYRLRGDVSSQFITGLLYALPLLEGDSEIRLTTALESSAYVDMTVDALKHFGVEVRRVKGGWDIPGGQRYLPQNLAVEADWSQAGFWCAAAGIGNSVEVTGMNPNSVQGDKAILEWGRMLRGESMKRGIAVPIWGESSQGIVKKPSEGCAVSIDVSENPDLVPPLAAWGALMNGRLHIKNAGRLRMKESDRLAAVTEVLSAMGAKIIEGKDDLHIEGQPSLSGGVTVNAWGDHRIAMMAAIAATCCKEPVTVTGAECVRKSYPAFWADYAALGGILEVTE